MRPSLVLIFKNEKLRHPALQWRLSSAVIFIIWFPLFTTRLVRLVPSLNGLEVRCQLLRPLSTNPALS